MNSSRIGWRLQLLPGLWKEPASCLMLALHQRLLHPSAFDEHFCMSLSLSSVGKKKVKTCLHAWAEYLFSGGTCWKPLSLSVLPECPNIDMAMTCTNSLYTLQTTSAQGRHTQGFSSLVLTKSPNVALSLYHLIKSPIIEFSRWSWTKITVKGQS